MKNNEIYNGLRVLLKQCLDINKNEQLLLIYDEDANPYVDVFINLIADLEIPTTIIFLSKKQQTFLSSKCKGIENICSIDLPAGIVNAISESTSIITLLSSDSQTSIVRKEIINQQRRNECKFAHLPGINDKIIFALLDSPVDEICLLSELIAWSLGEGERAKLITYGKNGEKYELKFHLGNWDLEPLMSPGVFFPGTWGNIPPGETFCCPDHNSVTGEICINGSVPGAVLLENDEILLKFSKGEIVDWVAEPNSKGQKFFQKIENFAKAHGDDNWCCFAEFGVGLNPSITNLTGSSLFDEKAYGTVHIAIGDNKIFGFSIEAFNHYDLISKKPTLIIDDKKIIENGEIKVDSIQTWRKNVAIKEHIFTENMILNLDKSKIEVWNNRYYRRLCNGGRVGYISMCSRKYDKVLSFIGNFLKDANDTSYEYLIDTFDENNFDFEVGDINHVLNLLNHYKVLDIK